MLSFTELRQLAPPECVVRVATVPEYVLANPQPRYQELTSYSPIRATWLGGARLASNRAVLKDVMVTRQEYQEHGSAWLLKRFGQSISR